MGQWDEFIAENYPTDSRSVATGDRVARSRAVSPLAQADWTVVNIEMLRTYMMPPVETVIFDEYHRLRGRTAEQSKNAEALAKHTPRVYGLTATPIYKDVGDLWHLLHMLDPKRWSSYGEFLKLYAKTIDNGYNTRVVGSKNTPLLIHDLKPYLLRRNYGEVGLFLPKIIERHLVLDFDKRDRDEYKNVKSSYRFEDVPLTSASQVLHVMRRLTIELKAEAVAQAIDDAHHQSSCVLTWYVEHAEMIGKKIGGVVITGETVKPQDRRAVALDAIRKRKPIVATIASLSEGVDLSDCKNVILAEEDYLHGSMYQMKRRFQRWTENTDPIVMTYLRVKGTIDTDVHSASVGRGKSAREVLKEALAA